MFKNTKPRCWLLCSKWGKKMKIKSVKPFGKSAPQSVNSIFFISVGTSSSAHNMLLRDLRPAALQCRD